MRVTRKEVAAYAGVSEATVSYVVNNGPRPVAEATRLRVLEAIDKLQYSPNDVARSLVTRRTATIGIVLPDTANPFYGELARLIEGICFARQYTVMLCNSNLEEAREMQYVAALQARRVDGIIFMMTDQNSRAFDLLRQNPVPTVIVDGQVKGFHSVMIDDYRGGCDLANHLLSLGHRRFAAITHRDDKVNLPLRLTGFCDTLRAADLDLVAPPTFLQTPNVVEGEQAAMTLLAQAASPTAIFAHNDRVALGALSAMRRVGLCAPRDVSIAGYDNIVESSYFNPPLTTVAYPKEQIVNTALDMMFGMLSDPDAPTEPETVVLPGELIVRESTAPPP